LEKVKASCDAQKAVERSQDGKIRMIKEVLLKVKIQVLKSLSFDLLIISILFLMSGATAEAV